MFWRDPVHRLSTTTKASKSVRSNKRSIKCEPMKPQPPETNTLRAMENFHPGRQANHEFIYIATGRNCNERPWTDAAGAQPREAAHCARQIRPEDMPRCLANSQRPLRAWRAGGIAAAWSRGLGSQTRLFGLAHQLGKGKSKASQQQDDDDQACYRQ
jgi:hypothetical protein